MSSVTVTFHVGKEALAVPLGTNMYPESKPPASGWQGSANDDWVTVWFPGLPEKTKLMVVPLEAVTLAGTNSRGPPTALGV